MQSRELREKFLQYFKDKNHKEIKSSSLLPTDTSVLFTTAGMQQFALYLEGIKDPMQDFGTRHLCSSQKCFRTNDIEEVGDTTHHTFFEMLGNWSIGTDENGEYFKDRAMEYALDFLINVLKMDKERISVTVFKGDDDVEKDTEAIELWKKHGIDRIFQFSKKDNFWGPTAKTGPCGPCSELHYDTGKEKCSDDCGPNCECGKFVEVWNLVFMQYRKEEDGSYTKLNQTNIDTGSGFERLLALLNNKESAYDTDLFVDVIKKIEKTSQKKYIDNKKEFRVIADHIRSMCFLIMDEIKPSKEMQGYVLRRLIRRVIDNSRKIEINFSDIVDIYIKKFEGIYDLDKELILKVFNEEKEQYEKILNEGEKLIGEEKEITAKQAFDLSTTHGYPISELKAKGYIFDEEEFNKLIEEHKEISRAGAAKLFGGHGADNLGEGDKEKVTKLHTATHLLQAALRKVLGDTVKQMGSNITPERLRFDFSFERKMTDEEKKQVEDLVNEQIQKEIEITKEEKPYQTAINEGCLAFFKEKYPDIVNVYKIGDFSKELCGGPHVSNTKELGKFIIKKEESVGSGIRRIKAILL